MSAERASAPVSAVVDLRAGVVIARLDPDPEGEIARFAPAASELYGQESAAWAYSAFEATVRDLAASSLHEIVVVGADRALVAQRLPWEDGQAVITVGRWDRSVGTVVVAARAALDRLERER